MQLRSGNSARQAEREVANAEAPELEKVQWWSDPGLRKLYFFASILCLASATNGYDGSMLNTSQNLNAWQKYFHHPTGAKLGVMNAIFQIGSLVTLPIVPVLADRFGRRMPIAIGCVLMVLGGFLTAFCNGFGMYLGGRFLVGAGNSLASMASPVLLTEICHPQHRAKVTALYNCMYEVGYISVSLISLGTLHIHTDWSWRTLALLQAIPAIFQLAAIYWIPESPRWLMSKERYDEAMHTLAHYHANGDANNATVLFEFREIKETIQLEFQNRKSSSYLDFLRTKGNRYRLMLLISLGVISQYSGNALFSNYSNLIYEGVGIKSQTQKILLNTGKAFLGLFVCTFSSFLIDRVGRRPLFLNATVGMFVMFLAWTIIGSFYDKTHDVASTGYPQLVFIWLFGIFYDAAWVGLLVAYALEILPFKLRAKGLMIMNLSIQCALTLGNETNPIAWKRLPHHWNLSMIYTIWIAFELAFVYFFYVETKGPTLEEIAKVFDGEEAEVARVDMRDIQKEVYVAGEVEDEKKVPNAHAEPV